MKIFVSSTEYVIVIDTKETTLEEWMMICLEQQYPLVIQPTKKYYKKRRVKNKNDK